MRTDNIELPVAADQQLELHIMFSGDHGAVDVADSTNPRSQTLASEKTFSRVCVTPPKICSEEGESGIIVCSSQREVENIHVTA